MCSTCGSSGGRTCCTRCLQTTSGCCGAAAGAGLAWLTLSRAPDCCARRGEGGWSRLPCLSPACGAAAVSMKFVLWHMRQLCVCACTCMPLVSPRAVVSCVS
jgi:hypothetical protein